LEYAVKRTRNNKLNWTNQILAYADDINIVGKNIDAMQRNTEALLDINKDVGLEVNAGKNNYVNVTLSEGRTKA
jgi:hypothetical protein